MSKINLKQQQPELYAHDLPALIDLYLTDCKPRIAPTTVKDYSLALAYLRRWWLEVGPDKQWVLRKNDMIAFVEWMEVQPSRQGDRLEAGTIDTVCKRIKQLFQWSYEADYLDRDYSHWMPAINVQPKPRNLPAPAELNRLFRVASESNMAARNKAILALLIGTGIRRMEAVDIDIPDITWNTDGSGKIDIRCGKGGKRRTVVFDTKAGSHVKMYLAITKFKHGPLFRGRNNARLGAKALYSVVKTLVERAGLEDKIQGPHDLRRMFATEWLRRNHSEGAIQPLSLQLGHSDPQMTLKYSRQNIGDIQKNFTSPMNAVDE